MKKAYIISQQSRNNSPSSTSSQSPKSLNLNMSLLAEDHMNLNNRKEFFKESSQSFNRFSTNSKLAYIQSKDPTSNPTKSNKNLTNYVHDKNDNYLEQNSTLNYEKFQDHYLVKKQKKAALSPSIINPDLSDSIEKTLPRKPSKFYSPTSNLLPTKLLDNYSKTQSSTSPSNVSPKSTSENSNQGSVHLMPPPATLPTVHMPQSQTAGLGVKQLSKLKRFLTTLQQFASDISPEIGDSVKNLVLNLVNSSITIEEFHTRLQEATNFPLRPFVIPFLKANLPLLQRELLHFARMSKLSTSEYINQNVENILSFQNEIPNNHHQQANSSENNECTLLAKRTNGTNGSLSTGFSEENNNSRHLNENSISLKRKSTDENINSSNYFNNYKQNVYLHQNNNNNDIDFMASTAQKQQRTAKSNTTQNNSRAYHTISPPLPSPPINSLNGATSQSLQYQQHQNQQGNFSFALPTPPNGSAHPPSSSSLLNNSYFTPPLPPNSQNLHNINNQLYSHIQNQQNVIGSDSSLLSSSKQPLANSYNNNINSELKNSANNTQTYFNNNSHNFHPQFQQNQLQTKQNLFQNPPTVVNNSNSSNYKSQNQHPPSVSQQAPQEHQYQRSLTSPSNSNTTISQSKNNQIKIEDIIILREMKEKEKNFNNYMTDFEHDFGDEAQESSSNEDEFINIERALSSITEMVNKTKKLISQVQQKSIRMKNRADSFENQLKRKNDFDSSNNDERADEIKKKAENTINEVRRQAHMELQRVITASETKTNEILRKERENFEITLEEFKKHYENLNFKQSDNLIENCWNCGRKAAETCSGCQKAKYCSQFCQHKHWDVLHHKLCISTMASRMNLNVNTNQSNIDSKENQNNLTKNKNKQDDNYDNYENEVNSNCSNEILSNEKSNKNEESLTDSNKKDKRYDEKPLDIEEYRDSSPTSDELKKINKYKCEEREEIQVIDEKHVASNLNNHLLNSSISSTNTSPSTSPPVSKNEST